MSDQYTEIYKALRTLKATLQLTSSYRTAHTINMSTNGIETIAGLSVSVNGTLDGLYVDTQLVSSSGASTILSGLMQIQKPLAGESIADSDGDANINCTIIMKSLLAADSDGDGYLQAELALAGESIADATFDADFHSPPSDE